MNLFKEYGIKEVADVTFYSIEEIGDEKIYIPTLFFDSLKITEIDSKVDSAIKKGGKANQTLLAWDFGREISFKMEDALFNPASINIIFGGKFNKKMEKGLRIYKKGQITKKYAKKHYSPYAYPSPELTDDEWKKIFEIAESIEYPSGANNEKDNVYRITNGDNAYVYENRIALKDCYYNRKIRDYNYNIGNLLLSEYHRKYTLGTVNSPLYKENTNRIIGTTLEIILEKEDFENFEKTQKKLSYILGKIYDYSQENNLGLDLDNKIIVGEFEGTINSIIVNYIYPDSDSDNDFIINKEKYQINIKNSTFHINENYKYNNIMDKYFDIKYSFYVNRVFHWETLDYNLYYSLSLFFSDFIDEIYTKLKNGESCTNFIKFKDKNASFIDDKGNLKTFEMSTDNFEKNQFFFNDLHNIQDEVISDILLDKIFDYAISPISTFDYIENNYSKSNIIDRMEVCFVENDDGLIIDKLQQKENLIKFYKDIKNESYTIFYNEKTMKPFLSDTYLKKGTKYYKWTRTINKDNSVYLGQSLNIDAETFSGMYKIVGETYIREQKTGKDQRYQFVLNNVKITPESNLSLEAEGEPVVFSMNGQLINLEDNEPMLELIQYNVEKDLIEGGTRITPQKQMKTEIKKYNKIETVEQNIEIY